MQSVREVQSPHKWKTPGFGSLVPDQESISFASLINRLQKICSSKLDIPNLSASGHASHDVVSNAHASAHPSSAEIPSAKSSELDNLRISVGNVLKKLRARFWPSAPLNGDFDTVVGYTANPFIQNDFEKPKVAKGMAVGSHELSTGALSFEVLVTKVDELSELGWLTHLGGITALNFQTGAIRCGPSSIQYLPPSLKIRIGDVVATCIDFDRQVLYYTLNGIKLFQLHMSSTQDSNSASLAQTPGSISKWPLKHHSLGFLPNIKVRAVTTMPEATISMNNIYSHSEPSVHHLSVGAPFKALKAQADLIFDLIFEVLMLVPPVESPKTPILKSPARSSFMESTETVLGKEEADSILNMLIFDTQIGLSAVCSDEALSDTKGFTHIPHIMTQSFAPFLMKLLRVDSEKRDSSLLDAFLDQFSNMDDSWIASLFSSFFRHLLWAMRGLGNNIAPVHPKMVLMSAYPFTWHEAIEIFTKIVSVPRFYYLLASDDLLGHMLKTTFISQVMDHPVRLEPYLAKESWKLFETQNSGPALADALQPVRHAMQTRLAGLSKLVYTLSRHLPMKSGITSRVGANEFILALREHISQNQDMLRNNNAPEQARPAYNGLLFALLGAIALAKSRADEIFNQALLSRVLINPARSFVDRFGGTFGHVLAAYPHLFDEPKPETTEKSKAEFPDAETGWPFELLDACVYLTGYSLFSTVAALQVYANDLSVAETIIRSFENSKAQRKAPWQSTLDIDMCIQSQIASTNLTTVKCLWASIEILDKDQFLLLKKFGDWLSQVMIHTTLHPTQNYLVHYIPEYYVHTLITVERIMGIMKTDSAVNWVLNHDYPPDNPLMLPPELREDVIQGQDEHMWYHSQSVAGLLILVQKKVLINPNLVSIILSYLYQVLKSQVSGQSEMMGPKRFGQYLDVAFSYFPDKNFLWTGILDTLICCLSWQQSTTQSKTFTKYFKSWVSVADNLEKVEGLLNALFNNGSWAENEFDAHVDKYLELLKSVTSNLDSLLLKESENENLRHEGRNGRHLEERGFTKESAKSDWKLVELPSGKYVVELPSDRLERLKLLQELIPIAQGSDVPVREAPLYLSVLAQLLSLLASISELNPSIFLNPIIMTRTCELAGHTLRRALDEASASPLIKLARLMDTPITQHQVIRNCSIDQGGYFDINPQVLLVFMCTRVLSALLTHLPTKTPTLTHLQGLLPPTTIDFYLSLAIPDIRQWENTSTMLFEIKAASNREFLLRSGQEECPICYANPVNTTFEPCGHRSCNTCIDRHLLNSSACFFCKGHIKSTRRDGT